jgi:hypothetical protein
MFSKFSLVLYCLAVILTNDVLLGVTRLLVTAPLISMSPHFHFFHAAENKIRLSSAFNMNRVR